jgi:hypothetical protein
MHAFVKVIVSVYHPHIVSYDCIDKMMIGAFMWDCNEQRCSVLGLGGEYFPKCR